jgi:hypothetical protein
MHALYYARVARCALDEKIIKGEEKNGAAAAQCCQTRIYHHIAAAAAAQFFPRSRSLIFYATCMRLFFAAGFGLTD